MSFKDALDQVKEKGMQLLLLRFELEAELDSDRMWLIGPVTENVVAFLQRCYLLITSNVIFLSILSCAAN